MTRLFHLTVAAGTTRKRCQQGYAMMMVIFFTALLLLATMAAAPRILLDGKREKEQEMIWRGKQYVRGVKLYYRKMGRFPTSVDDLTKPKTGSLRFMRQPYKDPMNGTDGSWRLIYVGPSGQLIGSLKPPQTLQIPAAGPGLGTPASTLANGQQPGSSQQPSAFGGSIFGNTPAAPGGAGATPPAAGGTSQQNSAQPNPQSGTPSSGTPDASAGTPTDSAGTDSNAAAGAGDAPNLQAETPTIIGGNIIGVGSKIAGRSVIIYDKATNYRLFEFIWDPSKDTTIAGQPGMQTGTGLGQNPGANSPFGQQPGAMNPNPATSPQSQPQPPPANSQPAPPQDAPLDSRPAPEPGPQR
jgi:hypothetical protein